MFGVAVHYQEFFFAHTGTGERTIRQTDRQMLWLYLAVFRCQTAKQSYKLIR